MTDAAVVALAEHCPGLTAVDLRRCVNLTDVAEVALDEHCPDLIRVHLEGCENVADKIREQWWGN